MHKEFSDRWSNLYQSLSKPMADLTELNMKTLTRWTQNTDYIDAFLHAKKPEEIIAAQVKLLNSMGGEALRYTQDACGILLDALNNSDTVVNDLMNETNINRNKRK